MAKKWFNTKILPVILWLVAIFTSIGTARDGGDFDVYLDAAKKLSGHLNIYAPPFVKGLQYYYSVFFAWILTPFCNYIFITEFFWSLLSYILLYRTFQLVAGYVDRSSFTGKQYGLWVFLIVLLSIQFILYNVAMIQVTFFLLWAVFESLHHIFKGKYVLGGFILGLAINIKLMPILLFPYLFYRGYFKSLLVSILTFILLLFIPAIGIGWDFNMFLLSSWWTIINPGNKEHLFETGIGMHSIVSLLPVYLTETTGEMPYRRHILNLDHQTVEAIINISRLFILSLSLFFLKWPPFKKETNPLKLLWEIAYFALIIPLLMPHQQKYAFIFALPMISYLLYFFITTYDLKKTYGYHISLFTLLICMLLYSPLYGSDIIGGFLFKYTQHYRFLTFATLFIIPVSMYCSPNKLFEIKGEKSNAW
jgi:hypothetical protein